MYFGPHDIRIQEVPKPNYGPEGMLVRIKACGICNIIDLPNWQRLPEAGRGIGQGLGHEWSGEVVETGSAVTAVKPGDIVYGHRHAPCYRCEACPLGEYDRCVNLYQGIEVMQGAFAEYISFHRVMPENGLAIFPGTPGSILKPSQWWSHLN